MIDLDRLRDASRVEAPFDHVVVPGFVQPTTELDRDFPDVPRAGSFPLSELSHGPVFDELVAELRGGALRSVVERKFDIDLTGRPTMLTVRGHARSKDGRIHTDSKWKIVTLLIYMNRDWSDEGGHLRLLRSPENLDDYVTDIAPEYGTAVLFVCAENAWHGHTPFVGARRAIQLNWVEDESWVRREQRRHRWSSRVKQIFSASPKA